MKRTSIGMDGSPRTLASPERWAVFDIDGTLLPGPSMEARFVRYAWRAGLIGPRGVCRYFLRILQMVLCGRISRNFRNNKMIYSGIPCKDLDALAEIFVKQEIVPQLAPAGILTAAELKQRGFRILILSGAPLFLAHHLVKTCRADACIAARLGRVDGRYTGALITPHPYGREKRQILLSIASQLGIQFHDSIVFANHASDASHMSLFGEAVAVNGDRRLRQIARLHGWGCETWQALPV